MIIKVLLNILLEATRLLPENVNESCVLHDNDYLTEMFQVINNKDGQRKLVQRSKDGNLLC